MFRQGIKPAYADLIIKDFHDTQNIYRDAYNALRETTKVKEKLSAITAILRDNPTITPTQAEEIYASIYKRTQAIFNP